MTTISKRDALQLAADIRRVKVGGHAIAVRTGGRHGDYMAGFIGGLESVLRYFVQQHAGSEAAAAIEAAMNYTPSADEIDAHNAALQRRIGATA